MTGTALKKVVVAGRDAPVWLAANVLHVALAPQGVTVEVVELPASPDARTVHATQPALEALHRRLGLDESQLLEATGGAFTLGQRFRRGADEFVHPYGSVGMPIGNQAFIQHWLKARQFGLSVAFEDFSLTAAAAKAGRMLIPDEDTRAFARTDYGYHLPAPAYAAFLKGLAVHRGLTVHESPRVAARRDGEHGTVTAVALDGGRTVDGDLFIDASGADALLIGGERQSWRDYFPCDRQMRMTGERLPSIPLFAQITAHDGGWTGFYPAQAATGLANTYASAVQSDDEAFRTLAAAFKPASGQAAVTRLDPGRRHEAWRGNCIAIGEAACRFDPLHSVDLQAVQLGLVYLLALFPGTQNLAAEQAEYNRLTAQAFERIRDFQAIWYVLNGLAPAPAALRHKIDTFRARGDVAMLEGESFPLDSWQALFLGCGLVPETWSPQIDRLSPELMKDGFRTILARIKQAVDKQPSHDAYLEIFCQQA